MGRFDSPDYDECRRWIQKKFEGGNSWDSIRTACKSTENELVTFLTSRISEDDWPRFSVEDWKALVTECEDVAGKQQELKFRGNDGALFSTTQDNALKIPENERSSWQLYKNSLGWNPDSVKDLEDATIGILRRLSTDTRETGPIKGLVIGHVQSGKTANMEALMAMAADHGWNMFIVLSGSIESLRLQTLKRMQKDLNQEGNLIWRGVEHPSKKSQYGERLHDLHFEPGSQSRYFTVCLKHASRLKKLLDWLHADRASHEQMKILVIDDEADQASISNTAVEYSKAQKERKGINKLIVNLVEDEHYKPDQTNGHALAMNYVMYTATPYANFLNESTPDSLYPSHFIWTLKTSKEYIGPNQIFGLNDPEKSDGLDIKCVITDADLDRIEALYEGESELLPDSLMDAICWFMCATAVMRFWGHRKPISMLVHTSQKQYCHEIVAKTILKWVNTNLESPKLLTRCQAIYERETARIPKEIWLEEFDNYGVAADQIKDYPEFDEIKEQLKLLFSEKMQHIKMTDTGDLKYQTGLHLVIDNCSKNGVTADNEHIRLAYPDPDAQPYPFPAPAFIVVGGSTLSRGLTIEGLVCTYFLRASCQADTLMQMGRWFGYRRNYELLPRIWMTSDTINKFRFLSELETDLREDLKKYMLQGVMPSEYGPRILCSPKVSWLKLTSRNHQKNATPAKMDFSGARPQTVIFDKDVSVQEKNIKATDPVLDSSMTYSLGYVSEPIEFSYNDDYEEFPLTAESDDAFGLNVKVKIVDPRCTWDPETHNLKLLRKCRFTSAYSLFGNNGICATSATLGVALRWISTQSDERGVIPFGELTKNDSSAELEASAYFDKGRIKGSLKIQTILYLKDAGTPDQTEMYFAQQSGAILGILDSCEAYVDGNGSLFPISIINDPGKPLWSVYYNEACDALQDRFSDENVEIRLNQAHPNFSALKIESSMVESPLFIEVLSSALMVIVESAKLSIDDEWDNVLLGEGFETGSIAEAVYYFVSKLGWDISSPSRLSMSIREFFERKR